VTFDVCPISNVGLKVVPSMKEHPLRRLMIAGILCTVSTDDPLCFANSLNEEYETLVNELTFSRADLGQLVRNGWEVADVPATTRKQMLAEVDAIVATAG
jgi:adenine deaminase